MSKRPNSRATNAVALSRSADQSARPTNAKPTTYPKQKLAAASKQARVMVAPADDPPFGVWDIDVQDMQRATGRSLYECYCEVADRWLLDGKVDALVGLLRAGYVPDRKLLVRILGMLMTDKQIERRGLLLSGFPFQLVVQSRSGSKGRRRDPDAAAIDSVLARKMHMFISEQRLKYNPALDATYKWSQETGHTYSKDKIRKAYDRVHGKKTRI